MCWKGGWGLGSVRVFVRMKRKRVMVVGEVERTKGNQIPVLEVRIRGAGRIWVRGVPLRVLVFFEA